MRIQISPSFIQGNITAPASKSAMQRACALALLHAGETLIANPGKSNDDLAAIEFISNLGAKVDKLESGDLRITSGGFPVNAGIAIAELNCGESGLGIRMFTPIAALQTGVMLITGAGSLLQRPMDFFDAVLPQLGVGVTSNGGKLPIRIQGPLQPKNITIDGSLSSQFLTGMLIAFGYAATEPVTITVTNLKSRPYIDLTLQMMQQFGYNVRHEGYEQFIISPKKILTSTQAYTVEGDWSGAAFLLVAGAIAGNITVKGLDVFSAQGDKAILQALMQAGAVMSIEEKQIAVGQAPGKLGKAFHFDATDCPDLFPPLVALAAYCEGRSVIEGVSRLAHKESNRALSLQEEFGKLGISIELQDDLMLVEGGNIKGATVHSHADHRIAMAAAIAALGADGPVVIEEAEAVNKSYPGFYEDLKMLGAAVSLQD